MQSQVGPALPRSGERERPVCNLFAHCHMKLRTCAAQTRRQSLRCSCSSAGFACPAEWSCTSSWRWWRERRRRPKSGGLLLASRGLGFGRRNLPGVQPFAQRTRRVRARAFWDSEDEHLSKAHAQKGEPDQRRATLLQPEPHHVMRL